MVKPGTAAIAAIVLLAQPVTASGVTAGPAESLLSVGKRTTTSTVENESFGGALAVDGDSTTRWASLEGDPQWIAVDLGGPADINRVKIHWESAHAKDYQVQASDDGQNWRDVKTVVGSDGGLDEFTGLNTSARHVRIFGTARATVYGYSLWELEVHGVRTGDGDIQPPSVPTRLRQASSTTESITLGWTASTDDVGVAEYEVLRNGNVIGRAATTSYTDTSLASGFDFQYAVRARDAAGNLSGATVPVKAATRPSASDGIVIALAGDIAKPELPSEHQRTAELVSRIKPRYVLTVGDNQYVDGTIEEFRSYYDKTWGKFKRITKPTPGNHEWNNDLAGYEQYFGKIATPKGKPYYSFDVGAFHFVALDSDPVYNGGGAEQVAWLRKDLAKTKKSCIAGYWHHPRFNSGNSGDAKSIAPLWNELARAKADVVFAGHDHHYERTKPLDVNGHVDEANGVRSVIAGIGGDSLYLDYKAREGVEKILGKHGVMKLVLKGKTYSWEIIGTNGELLDKAGPFRCR